MWLQCIILILLMSFRFIFHHAYPTLWHFVSYGRLGHLVSSCLALQHRQRITCASSVVTSFRCNLYFYCCRPEFSPFRPSSDSSSSSSHNAQNSHHEDKPKGSYFQEALLMTLRDWFNIRVLSNLCRRSTQSSAPANPRWGRIGWSYASHETSEYFSSQDCDAS